MALFNFGKKKESTCCCCGCDCETEVTQPTAIKENGKLTSITVLGAGCGSCHEQLKYAKKAVKNMGSDIEVEYITDLTKVMEYGVMNIPALVVNGKVISQGKVMSADEILSFLRNFD